MTRKCEGWCGLCYENARRRANHKGHYGYRRPTVPYRVPWWEIAAMKKPTGGDGASAPLPPASGVLAKCPTLFTFMTDALWDDGTVRDLPTLLFFRDQNHFKVCVSDRALGKVAFVTGDSVEALFLSLEKDLVKGDLDWRVARSDGPKRR